MLPADPAALRQAGQRVSAATASLLADAVLLLHVCIAAFVIVGLAVVVIGNVVGWRWVNQRWFRLAHLLAIAVIVTEVWFGFSCPLTSLEMWLRSRAGVGGAYAGGFVEHWMSRLLYYQAPPWVFLLAYSVFGLLVAASWWYFPPASTRHGRDPVAEPSSPRPRV